MRRCAPSWSRLPQLHAGGSCGVGDRAIEKPGPESRTQRCPRLKEAGGGTVMQGTDRQVRSVKDPPAAICSAYCVSSGSVIDPPGVTFAHRSASTGLISSTGRP